MNILHNDERIFWRTMTPYRCAVLYGEYFKARQPRRSVPAPARKQITSLFDYVQGR